MTKAEVRSLIRNSLPKYDKAGRWADRYLDSAITKAYAQMLEDVWRMSPLNLQRYIKQYGYNTAIAVSTEAGTGISYSTLPAAIVPFQDKLSGVRRISTIAQGGFLFYPMDAREMELLASGAYVNNVSSKIGYAVNQTRIEYYGMIVAVSAVGVRMDLIVPFSEYDETEQVLIPEIETVIGSGGRAIGETFVDRVMKILAVVQPIDVKDDNSSAMGVNTKDS